MVDDAMPHLTENSHEVTAFKAVQGHRAASQVYGPDAAKRFGQ
jgi:hypothetical protein